MSVLGHSQRKLSLDLLLGETFVVFLDDKCLNLVFLLSILCPNDNVVSESPIANPNFLTIQDVSIAPVIRLHSVCVHRSCVAAIFRLG